MLGDYLSGIPGQSWLDHGWSATDQDRCAKNKHLMMLPRVWLPDFDEQTKLALSLHEEAELALFPIMRPVQSYSEGELVPVHRFLCILQYFNFTHGTEASRVEWLELHEALMQEEFEVTSLDIPWWMSNRL